MTIATNMAGRGADIVLGEGVRELGGLHIIGTERHESRRIDNQLRGRAGRQGDPGSSRFYVSLEDDLMRLFGSEHIMRLMDRLGWDENQPIEHTQISHAIEVAQKRVESHNFDIRKHVLEYDDVMNQQRTVIYQQRRQVLTGTDLKPAILSMFESVIDTMLDRYANERVYEEDWDLDALIKAFADLVSAQIVFDNELKGQTHKEIKAFLLEKVRQLYEKREEEVGHDVMRVLERGVMLRVIDSKWMDHLHVMDSLREGIGLRAYGQKDPLLEYKHEAYEMFMEMIAAIQEGIVTLIFKVRLVDPAQAVAQRQIQGRTNEDTIGGTSGFLSAARDGAERGSDSAPMQRKVDKVGRNEPCPCGSGLKYKRCCGRNAV